MTSLVVPHVQIDLSRHAAIKRGKQRDVYFLKSLAEISKDEDTPIVLKVPRYAERQSRQVWYKRLLRILFPSSTLRIITKEANYWQRLARMAHRKGSTPPIPDFVAYVNTSAGPGAVWEAICDKSGNLAPTAAEMAKRQKRKRMIKPLNRFVQKCFDDQIVAPDLHLGNLACKRVNGRREFFLVDGFGDHRVISIRALWPAYNARSLIRSFERIAWVAGLQFDQETRMFSLQQENKSE